ncbi:MAG TPA: metallophosphoesterase family protein [Bacteroidota bacterium]|nr:metallophosphoesterase family protein [Bacteroidota bacterium]
MKLAIISDIHGNLEGLMKALSIIDERRVDEIVCLGDVVGYGANPNECLDLVRKRCSVVIKGNHDEAALDPQGPHDFNPIAQRAIDWTGRTLSAANKVYLGERPMVWRSEGILFVHASPRMPELWNYIVSTDDALDALRAFEERICFIGHTHLPGIFSLAGRSRSVAKEERFLVNVGSVGQPRDGNPMLAFGIFDSDAWSYELVRSEYDIHKATEKIIAAGLPEELGYRLMYGM